MSTIFLAKRQQAQFTLKKDFWVNAAPLTSSGWATAYRVENAFSIPRLVTLARFNQPTKIGPFTTDIVFRLLAGTDDVEYQIVSPAPPAPPPTDPTDPTTPTPPPTNTTTTTTTIGISAAVQAELDKKAPLDETGKVPIANLPLALLSSATGSDKYHVHQQSTAATTWMIQHNLNKYPSVMITDNDGYEVVAVVRHLSINSLSISFTQPFAGVAYFN